MDLSPFEFLDRLAAIILTPRKHRHWHHGVFASNHPLRRAVTATAIGNVKKPREAVAGENGGTSTAAARVSCGFACSIAGQPCHHDTSGIAFSKLLVRLGEEFPLACPNCGGDIWLISFITQPETIRKILMHLGEPLEPLHVSPGRGPPVAWVDLVQPNDDHSLHQSSPA